MTRLETLGVVYLACAAVVWPATSALGQRYRMTDLGVLPGQDPPHDESHAYGINNRGQIVGVSYNGTRPNFRGFIWEKGEWRVLPPIAYNHSQAYGINEQGVVCGQSATTEFGPHAVLWIDGEPVDIHVIGNQSSAHDLNDDLVVCGAFWYTLFPQFPFMWRDGVMTQLRVPPPGGPYDSADAINNDDFIVGNGAGWPVLWTPPTYDPLILETLPYDFGVALDIHDNGMSVGWLDEAEGVYYGAIWEGTRLTRLLPRPGAPEYSSTAQAVNARGEVIVGARLFLGAGGYHNFIWRKGVMLDLQDLVGPGFEEKYFGIRWANDINDLGQIAGSLTRRVDGLNRAVLLDPLDEGFAVWSITPCTAGVENVIEVVNAEPGSIVHLVFGLKREGAIPVSGCPEAFVEIRNPRLIGRARADANGRAEFRAFVPEQVARKTFVLQAIDRTACEVSPPAWTLFMEQR